MDQEVSAALGHMQDGQHLQPATARPGSAVLGMVFLLKSTLSVLLRYVMSQCGEVCFEQSHGVIESGRSRPEAELSYFSKPPLACDDDML